MPAHSRKWAVYRTTTVILCMATALWVAAYWAAGSMFEVVDEQAPSTRLFRVAHAGLAVPARSSGEQDPVRVRLERLSELEMKLLYARCAQESIDRRLDGGEAMACSIGYDILLKKHFDGDFERFLLWSRTASASP